jgi:hypothetical protein
LNSAARKSELNVVYINDAHYESDFEIKRWGLHALKGTKGAEVIEELKPHPADYIVEKRAYSGFFETGLDSLLRSLLLLPLSRILYPSLCSRFTNNSHESMFVFHQERGTVVFRIVHLGVQGARLVRHV